ncbi:uncharacterized protein EV420DRAFT_1517590 [Desarmillaria tabescens]|uniref:Uncharacterized protein n=1 Tax=Armillaria tabescens TaxID=1929756 RepID=A0AA39NFT6_ARMTA|nr:uncharacterized protein EV420DRAFT_1517590 [Desarmillaria tabescens]KAK0464678.1 hypothetical protein EV420DRAFT_1517590 [Desarmillaria tabescens]
MADTKCWSDIEAVRMPVARTASAYDRRRLRRWGTRLEVQLMLTFCLLLIITPFAIYALCLRSSHGPVQVKHRFDAFLPGAYVMAIITVMTLVHCRAMLEEADAGLIFTLGEHPRSSITQKFSNFPEYIKRSFITFVVGASAYMNLACFSIFLIGWTDLLWQLYRTMTIAFMIISGSAIVFHALFTLAFPNHQVGLLPQRTVFSCAWDIRLLVDRFWAREDQKQMEQAARSLRWEFRDWIFDRSEGYHWMGGRNGHDGLRKIALNNLRPLL